MNTHQLATDNGVLNEFEAAALLNLSVHTLRRDRQEGQRVPFSRVGRRVIYRLPRLLELLEQNEVGGPPKRVLGCAPEAA